MEVTNLITVDNREIKHDFEIAQMKYPGLEYRYEGRSGYCHVVEGEIDIVDGTGTLWGSFEVSIRFYHTYPKGFALPYDKSRAFKWINDWHMNSDGECCVCSPLEKIEQSYTRTTIIEFIEGYVIPFYSNQVHRRIYGKYKNGAYNHGLEGIWESLEEEFNTRDREKIKLILEEMNHTRTRNDPCICGGAHKYKKCHMNRIKYIREMVRKNDIM